MRRSALIVLAGAGLMAIAASGFPKRVGLTPSQAAVSLPGDLLIPDADVVVDRGIEISASASAVWRVIEAAFEHEDEARVIAREENDYLLLRVPTPGLDEEEETFGTCVLAVLPVTPDRTILHMRERHRSNPPMAPRSALWAGLSLEVFSAIGMLRDMKKAAIRFQTEDQRSLAEEHR